MQSKRQQTDGLRTTDQVTEALETAGRFDQGGADLSEIDKLKASITVLSETTVGYVCFDRENERKSSASEPSVSKPKTRCIQ